MRRTTITRGIFSTAASALFLTIALAGGAGASAAPAAAPSEGGVSIQAITPTFSVYYSPNCSGASRYYAGPRTEDWINDRFDNTISGSGGAGQLIRNNAASVRLNSGYLTVDRMDGRYRDYQHIQSPGCQNLLPEFRNHNIGFRIS